MDLLNNKDEDIFLNCLRLIMTLITKKQGETTQVGRQLAEEKDNILLKRLIQIVNEETGIAYTHFSKQCMFMTISLLRAFIQHSSSTKPLIMADKPQQGRKNII